MNPDEFLNSVENNYPTDKQLQVFTQAAAALMCTIDGKADDSEKEKVRKLGKQFLKDNYDHENFLLQISEFDKGINLLKDKIGFIEGLSKKFSNFSDNSETEKLAILAFLAEIALADGKIHESELKLLEEISDNLEIKNPFNFKIDIDDEEIEPKEGDDELLDEALAEAFNTQVLMLTYALIQSDIVPKNRTQDCMTAITELFVEHPDIMSMIISSDETTKSTGLKDLSIKVREKLNISTYFGSESAVYGDTKEKDSEKIFGYSSTVYGDTEEEASAKMKKVNFYSAIGMISIFGLLGSFGYAIYLFLSDKEGVVIWVIIGVVLFLLNRWMGKNVDAITE